MKLLGSTYDQKIDIIEKFLDDNLNLSIDQFIKLKYDEKYLKFNKSDLFSRLKNKLKKDQIDFIISSLSKKHLRDKRTPFEYVCDLILGWIVEDAVLEIL